MRCRICTDLSCSYRENSAPDSSLLSQNPASVFIRNYNACRMPYRFGHCSSIVLMLPPIQPCVRNHVCEATVQLANPHGMLVSEDSSVLVLLIIVSILHFQRVLPRYCRVDLAVDLLAQLFLWSSGWRGDSCSLPRCRDTCDPVGGTCSVPGGCECNLGYSGPNCDIGGCIS
jgi:hypothetical protein